MKVHRSGADGFLLRLSAREKEIFFDTLRLYPLVFAAHHRLTKAAADQSAENQLLLEEALAQQRTDNRRQLEALLNDPERLTKIGSNFRLQLKAPELDWLLQVLNDVRVGSWLQLGEPDDDKPPEITPENFRYAVAMEVCGAFQSALLAVLGESESPDWQE